MRMMKSKIDFNNLRYSEFTYSKEDMLRIKKAVLFIPENSLVLDIGCGDGTISVLIRELKNCKVVGVDISSNALKLAKKKDIEVIQHNLEEPLPFKDSSFDCVFAGEIIEHIFDTDFFVREIWRVLKPHGKLIVTTPNLAGLGSRISLLLGKKPWMINNRLTSESAGHIRYFVAKDLVELLEDNGFKVVKLTGDCVKILPNLCIKFLSDLEPSLSLHLIVVSEKIEGGEEA